MLIIEKYADDKGEHRWRIKAGNGRIIADSAEGYDTAAGRDHGLNALLDGIRFERFGVKDLGG